MMSLLNKTKWASMLSLFTSGGTLVCCALPALLVALGAGAALSALVTAVPQLIWLSQHKIGVFATAAAMLMLAGMLQWRARYAPCPTEPVLAQACRRARRISLCVYGVSVGLFVIGGFFAFLAPLFL